MKPLTFLLVGGASAFVFFQSGSSALQAHFKAMQDAPSLTATLSVQPIGGAPTTYKLSYSKPNKLRVETPEGWTLCDGTTIYVFSKKDNNWTETAASDEAIKRTAGLKEAWAWAAFFDKEALKTVLGSKAGGNRVIKGTPTSELALTLENSGTATFFIDPKLGFARGFTLKQGETDLLVTSTDIQVGKEPLPASVFAFSAPAGATKLEGPKADEVTFAQVQVLMSRNCMPCHGAQQRAGGYELGTHQGIMQGIVPGKPEESKVIQVISGPNPTMPKMRPPMRAADVEALSKWVAAGAKK